MLALVRRLYRKLLIRCGTSSPAPLRSPPLTSSSPQPSIIRTDPPTNPAEVTLDENRQASLISDRLQSISHALEADPFVAIQHIAAGLDPPRRRWLLRQVERVQHTDIKDALSRIPSVDAAIIVLHYQNELTCEQIAQRLSVTERLVEERLTNARAHMGRYFYGSETGGLAESEFAPPH